MERLQQIQKLIELLLTEMPEYRSQAAAMATDEISQRRLLRSLMNVRSPQPLKEEYIVLQDQLLQEELQEKGIVRADALPISDQTANISLWQGDITRLQADAIVNAANSAMLGCFIPCHGCIDNAIHSAAGLQLRQECDHLMRIQGRQEQTGQAKLTGAYNLPCSYVIHTVGPVVRGSLRQQDCQLLASCYHSCLELAARHHFKSLAFCCISTGEFGFPHAQAAATAVAAVRAYQSGKTELMHVIFDVYKDEDYEIYSRLLAADQPA